MSKVKCQKSKVVEGLTSKEAKEKLEKFGPNVLPEKLPPTDLEIFISQLKNPLVYVLFIAGTVTLILGDFNDTIIIFLAVLINTVFSFLQERKASKALYALKKLIHPKAKVIRDGEVIQIDVKEVVPGDVVSLNAGDKVPADGIIVFANRLFITEAVLTGESVPVSKERKDKIFMGTIISSGQARFLVEKTGEETEVGKIAISVQEEGEDTPLTKQSKVFSRQLVILVIVLTTFVFIFGVLSGRNLMEIIITSVALAVSSIPEGLLIGLTVILAIGMQRILKKRGLVRNLVSAETLGGVTTICIDKTGTLTEGKMQVVEVVGDESEIAQQAILANDLDDPIVIAFWEWALGKIPNPKSKIQKYPRLDSIPFSSKEKFFACLTKWNDQKNMIFINGAPEYLLKWSDLKGEKRRLVKEKINELTSSGKRVIGMAMKKIPITYKKLSAKDVRNNLEWVGILAFSDPLREGVREALEKVKLAGIKLLVITGDYPQTAISVVKNLGISIDEKLILTGQELEKMSLRALSKRLGKIGYAGIFARTSPNQKEKIVEALKKRGEVVAMMGDGVNDAPALNKADIGIVVGEASDVAKETADLVLLDSNFATIVAAIEEGRGIFNNLRKIILYLMSDAFEEIIAVSGTLILGLPLPVSAAQILWINLVSDGFPNIALTLDPKQKGIMEKSPRSPKEDLVTSWMRILILVVSLVGGIMALIIFSFYYKNTNLPLARSIAFATLGVNSLVYVFSIRTLKEPFWEENPFDNLWLDIAVIGGLFLQVLPFASERLRGFFGIVALSYSQWLIVAGTSVLMFIIIEISKLVFRFEALKKTK